MKTVFWAQNFHPTEKDTLIVDSKGIDELSTEEIDEAHTLLKQFASDSLLLADKNNVCNKYNVPDNFKIWLHPEKGIMLQSSFLEKDMSNRSMPFVIWHYQNDIDKLTRILLEYLKSTKNTIAEGEIDMYIKLCKGQIVSKLKLVLLFAILILIILSIICLMIY